MERSGPGVAPPIETWPGAAYPLGATYDGGGTNFSLFSEVAEAVDLCLVASDGTRPASGSTRSTATCGTCTCRP